MGNRMSSEEGAEGDECRSEGELTERWISVGGHQRSSRVGGCVEVESRKKGSGVAISKVPRLVIWANRQSNTKSMSREI